MKGGGRSADEADQFGKAGIVRQHGLSQRKRWLAVNAGL
jgi:hypothetical protein